MPKNPTGIYWDEAVNRAAVAAGRPSGTGDFIVMGLDGPGCPFKTYIPKDGKVYPLVEETLRPTLSPEEVKERSAHVRPWTIKEKRLRLEEFKFQHSDGFRIVKGAHYPLCAFTQNPCRRSDVRHAERLKRWWDGHGHGPTTTPTATPTTNPRGSESSGDRSRGRQNEEAGGQGDNRSRGGWKGGQSSGQNEGQSRRDDDWQAGGHDASHSRGGWSDWQPGWHDASRSRGGWSGWQTTGRPTGGQKGDSHSDGCGHLVEF